MNQKFTLLAIASSVLLAACAPAAFTPISQSNPGEIRLGTSSPEDVKASINGGKMLEDDVTINGKSLHVISYRYNKSAMFFGLEAKTRYSVYFFYNNKLVGQEKSSRFEEDSTEFDVEKAKTIKDGVTRQQVVSELGKPAGEFIYPIAKNPGDTGIFYYNVTQRPVPFVGKTEAVLQAVFSLSGNVVDSVDVTDKTHPDFVDEVPLNY